MLANANEIKADFTFRRDWGIRTHLEELERRRSGTQRFVKDLTYIGTAEDGVEKFKLVSTNATVVYNTIFTRSERMEGHVKKFIRGIEEKKRELLSSGCTWLDIVLEKELDALHLFYPNSTLTNGKITRRGYFLWMNYPYFNAWCSKKTKRKAQLSSAGS